MLLVKGHVRNFLDGVDTVLNSNTFLLELTIESTDESEIKRSLEKFLRSGEFKTQIIAQDKLREWNNYSHTKNGEIIKPEFTILLEQVLPNDVVSYFRMMLTVEPNTYNFWSPYCKQFNSEKSEALVKNFIWELTIGIGYKVFRLNTDFSYTQVERNDRKNIMAYFEGDYGSDSATLILREDKVACLLLTNGRV